MSKTTLITAVSAIVLGTAAFAELPARTGTTDAHAAPAAAGHGDATVTPAAQVQAHGGAPHWSYPADGAAEDWGSLVGDFATCATGHEQSPINLVAATTADVDAVNLAWSTNADLTVVDNGHTIQVNVANGGGMNIGGKDFALLQFHFHAPSEHAMGGERTAMEVHFVHKADDGALAVVGVMMERGGTNALFNAVMTGTTVAGPDGFTLLGNYDLQDLLPEDRSIFRYQGSLTTPPCSEVVLWSVMQNPIKVSDEAVDAFEAIYPMNARHLQPVNRRFVLQN